jgi:hypothetical protein
MIKPRFIGEVDTRWIHDGVDRNMLLLRDFAFVDSRGKRWDAKKGRIINGASIPEKLWSYVIGTPYIGKYRRATVIHDTACEDMIESHEEVHRMFYEAMLCDGMLEERALVMYMMVRLFGPKWGVKYILKGGRNIARLHKNTGCKVNIDEVVHILDKMLEEQTDWQ